MATSNGSSKHTESSVSAGLARLSGFWREAPVGVLPGLLHPNRNHFTIDFHATESKNATRRFLEIPVRFGRPGFAGGNAAVGIDACAGVLLNAQVPRHPAPLDANERLQT